jgi:transcriptional regulator with XRE-family HTH domain
VRAKLTLEQAAHRAKMSIGQLSEVESGKRWYERWQSLDRLAGALGVTASELVDTADAVSAESWNEPPPHPARRKSRRKAVHESA